MSHWSCTVGAHSHHFGSLRELMAKATPRRSGDELAGVAAASAEERVAAQQCLADVPLRQFLQEPLVPYEDDEITRLIVDTHDAPAFAPVRAARLSKHGRAWVVEQHAWSRSAALLADAWDRLIGSDDMTIRRPLGLLNL